MISQSIAKKVTLATTTFTLTAGMLIAPAFTPAFAAPNTSFGFIAQTQPQSQATLSTDDITLFNVTATDNTTGEVSIFADKKQYDPTKTTIFIPETAKKTGLNIRPDIPTEGYLIGAVPNGASSDLKFFADTNGTKDLGYGNADLQVKFSGPGDVYVYDLDGSTVKTMLTHTGYMLDPKGQESIHVNEPQKKAMNWLFTKPGKYTFTVTPKLENSDFENVSFPSKTYTVEVGKSAPEAKADPFKLKINRNKPVKAGENLGFRISVDGAPADATVTFALDGKDLPGYTSQISHLGATTVSQTLPKNTVNGSHTLTATINGQSVSADFTVIDGSDSAAPATATSEPQQDTAPQNTAPTEKLAIEADSTDLKGGVETRFVARGMGHDDYVVFYVDGERQNARGYQPWPIDGRDGVTLRYAFPADATGEHTIGFTNGAALRHKKGDAGVKYTEIKVHLTPGAAPAITTPPVSKPAEPKPEPDNGTDGEEQDTTVEPENTPETTPTKPDNQPSKPAQPAQEKPAQPVQQTPDKPQEPAQTAPKQETPAANSGSQSSPNALLAADAKLTVATSHHVDAPRVFFENGSFDLKSEFDGGDKPLDSTINYFTHKDAIDRFGEHFTYNIAGLGPKFDFMAHPEQGKRTNTVWYTAPAVAGVKNAPIFSGFGAAADVPVDDFRDGSFTLDLVSVDGPGQMELFADSDPNDSAGVVQRLFSSSDIHHRSFVMEAGNHTHNYTAFSKPGRYVLKYRASARTKDGKLILGNIQTLQWQVGGNKPGVPLETESVKSTATKPTFSVAKAPERTPDDAKKHGQLRSVRVDLGTDAQGLAEFTIDGHHFATVKVVHGVAEFSEALSADVAKLQVQVTTDKLSWTSAALEVDPASEKTVQTTDSGAPVAKTSYPSPVLPSAESSVPNDFNAKISLSAGPVENTRKVTIEFPAAGYYGNVVFEGYDKPSSTVPNYTEFFNVTGEKSVSFIAVANDIYDGNTLRATFTPHAITKNAGRTNIKIVDGYTPGQEVSSTGSIPVTKVESPAVTPNSPATDAQPSAQPAAQDSVSTPAQNVPATQPTQPAHNTPEKDNVADKRLLITRGHLDIQALNAPNDGLDIKLKDDSTLFEKRSVVRDLDTFALVVPEEAAKSRNRFPQGAEYDAILGKETTYYLPPAQVKGLVWPGYSTENLNPYPTTPVSLDLVSADGPGQVTLFNVDNLSQDKKPLVYLGTAKDAPHSISMASSTHQHVAWAFTEPGVYSLKLRYSNGDKHSATKSLIILVGDKGIQAGAPLQGQDIEHTNPAQPSDAAPNTAELNSSAPNATVGAAEPNSSAPNVTAPDSLKTQNLPEEKPVKSNAVVADTPKQNPVNTISAESVSVATDKEKYDAGAEVHVNFSGLKANEEIRVVLHSVEIPLGMHKADAFGNLSFTYKLPVDLEVGQHRFIGYRADGSVISTKEFSVAAVSAGENGHQVSAQHTENAVVTSVNQPAVSADKAELNADKAQTQKTEAAQQNTVKALSDKAPGKNSSTGNNLANTGYDVDKIWPIVGTLLSLGFGALILRRKRKNS